MWRWKRWVLKAALFLTVVLSLAYLALYFLVQSHRFRLWFQAEIANTSGYEIQLGDLRINPFLNFVASAVILSKSERTLLQAERIVLTLSPFDFFARRIRRLQLHRPTLYLDLHELFDSPSQRSMDIAIRELNMDEGTVVLKTGERRIFDFRSVTMNAENLNVGQVSGLTLDAEVPWLEGRGTIDVRARGQEKTIALRVQQRPTSGISPVFEPESRRPDALTAKIALHRNENQELQMVASGNLNGLLLQKESVSGQLDFQANVEPNFTQAAFKGKVAIHLPANIGPIAVGNLKGPVTATVAGKYSVPERHLTVAAFRIESAAGTADGRGTIGFAPQLAVSNTRVNLRSLSLDLFKPLLPAALRGWTYAGTAEADLELQGRWPAIAVKGRIRSQATHIKSEQVSLAQLSVQAAASWAGGLARADEIQITGKNFALNQDNRRVAAREIHIAGGLEKKAGAPFHAVGAVQLLGGAFSTLDGSKVGENLKLRGRFDARTVDGAAFTSSGRLEIQQGEILWGKFFSDLKIPRPSLDFDADYMGAADTLTLRRVELSLRNVGTLKVAGGVSGLARVPTLRLDVTGDDIQPAGFFELFIRETLNRRYPILDELAFAGRLAFSLKILGALENLSHEGNIQLRAGHVRTKSNRWHIGPIDLTLPVLVYYPGIRSEAAPPAIPKGTLVIESARFGNESIPKLGTAISLWNNRLQLHQPVRVPLYGGAVEIRGVSWKDLVNEPLAVSLSMEAQNLQLNKLTEALGWYRFAGTLSGSIPQIEWVGGTLRSHGQIQVDVFGGRVLISKMEIENPLFPIPSIKLDARFHDIELERVSDTFEFGRIWGILEGVVDDLVIAAGQPSQFRADIHTVDRAGTGQWINVEALNKLTVLSSGDDASSVYGGLAVFFDNFRYAKMGFKATLRNDKLTLRGVESKAGKEFLVVGSLLPPTVNIISHTQEIGFSELVRRLERIKKTDKPQIK